MKSIGTHLFPHLKVGDSFLVEYSPDKSFSGNLANLSRFGFTYQIQTILGVKKNFQTEFMQQVTITGLPPNPDWKVQEIHKPGKVSINNWSKIVKRMNAFAKGEIDHSELYKQILELFS